MKKIIPYILITLIFANLFAPFSLGLENKKVSINKNIASASGPDLTVDGFKYAFPNSTISLSSAPYKDGQTISDPIEMKVNMDTGLPPGSNSQDSWYHVSEDTGIANDKEGSFQEDDILIKFTEISSGKMGWANITLDLLVGIDANNKTYSYLHNRLNTKAPYLPTSISKPITIKKITPIGMNGLSVLYQDTDYKAELFYQANDEGRGKGEEALLDSYKNYFKIAETTFKTASKATGNIGTTSNIQKATIVKGAPDPMPACSISPLDSDGTVFGCVAQILYYAVFTPTSFLFALAGTFFDYTFAYSVQDSSYRSGFVVQGWGIVRDFCNMFFIFVLLYVAFATILDIHGFSTKQTIINVIIIGVLINFSLFAAQIIIDTSNILARVFYNSQTIKITKSGANGVINNTPGIDVGENGVLPLSMALVNKVNPQNLIINASEVGKIPDKGGQSDDKGIEVSTFILITILASAINVIGFIVFLSVGLIFVARVIGLWLAMIVVPLTFFTYMVPKMQGLSMVGWKNWWQETLSLAFLAPVFIFFLYLILKFLEAGLSIIDANGKTGLEFVVAIVIPFAFIMILLMRAKDIAKKMSGEMGSAITGAATAVGGVALGLATGGAALAGRATIGRLANSITSSEKLNNLASGKTADGKGPRGSGLFSYGLQKAAMLGKKTADAGAKGTFDARQTEAANQLSKQLNMDLNKFTGIVGLGTKNGLGGYKAQQAEKVAKDEKFAKTLGYDHNIDHAIQHTIDDRKSSIANAEKVKDQAAAEVKLQEGLHGADSQQAKEAKQAQGIALKNINALKSGGVFTKEDGTTEKIEESLSALEKKQANNKTGREKEYALYKRKQSGFIYNETRDGKDGKGNIKSFGDPQYSGKKAAAQILKEFAEGFAKGAVIGGTAGAFAGPVAAGAGALGTGLFAAVRSVVNYSPSANKKVGEAHNAKPEKGADKYQPGAPAAHGGGHDDHGGGHDDHGGGHDDHGGGGHDDHGHGGGH